MTDNKIKDIEKIHQYWLSSSDSDYDAMIALCQSKKYNWALFLGHIVNARYDSFKEDFYKRCTPEFSAEWIEKIKTLRLWIKKML
jgi:hypothetical protein